MQSGVFESMLYFVGLGIEQSLTVRSVNELRNCEIVYFESYTSPSVNDEMISQVSGQMSPGKVEVVKREFVEDGRKILELSKRANVALLCSGDPMVATTHQELRTRAVKEGIATKVIHGSSILCAVGGEFGLHSYNFGRVVTMTREPMQYTAYNTIFDNLLRGLHTTILLEWNETQKFFLEPASAIRSLEDAERDLRQEILDPSTLILIASRLGSREMEILALTIEELKSKHLGPPPHVLVIPGRLHFTELEALSALFGRNIESFPDNSKRILRLSRRMVEKYTKKTLVALAGAKKAAEVSSQKINFADIFENVECYTRDSERFLNEGKDELAVLSIGYAEGLLDSLRFGGQLEFDW
ncbi:MAG TPA: diphthine synthase [Nitrososphaerales archaeon]|nr:diphthine synthase [Nitrososphaerales archaeon]